MWRKFAGAALVSGLLLMTACTSEPPPAAAPVQDDPPEKGQTITVINPPGAENKGTASSRAPAEDGKNRYQIQTRLTDFQLLSATTGLAWGCTRNELRLYMTQDNGNTWTNISPAASLPFAETPEYGKNIFFLDPNHGFIVRNPKGSEDTIMLRTTDGGATWKVNSFPENKEVSAMYFTDPAHGWMLSETGSSLEEERYSLYVTEDGGQSFENPSGLDNGFGLSISGSKAPSSNDEPISDNSLSLTFTSVRHGFIGDTEEGYPKLFMTEDGGLTWEENEQFFDRDKYTSCDSFTMGTISFFSENKQEGWVPIGCSREDSTKFNGYFTEDAGHTWSLVPFALSWQQGINELLAPTFLNSEEGWTILNSTVYYTSDQGSHWKPLPQSRELQRTLQNYPEIVKLQFFSSRVGWLLVAKEDQQRSLLMQTKDGGQSWKVL
ncbi:WD40/YVTN/BNR-like repeat-containing protein [Paenibacillus sanguinis]|uniref:WD40/YVTN/BNR-like repeat-containing protein n=1 Tax=Paenibacillus sanguinis TaxID=225906 RepID=UPI000379B3E6|nr:hypothetical protein [Paenibacillus sanguinis]